MPTCCLIIPCYNEAQRLPLEAFYSFLNNQHHFHCLFVDDGSTDNTIEILNTAAARFPDKISVHQLANNSGKAEAVRAGMLHAGSTGKYDLIGFIDADLSAPLHVMCELLVALEKEKNVTAAFGSRVKRLGANVERKLVRHILGRIFATFATQILNITAYDSQCGAKLFRSSTVSELFKKPFLSPWFFDLEIILRAGQNNIVEVPVSQWKEVGSSKIKFKDFIKAPFELLKIRRHYLSKK